MPKGPVYGSKEYQIRYDSVDDDDTTFEIPYVKVGQTTWNKSEDKSVYDAIRKMRGGNKTGYPVDFIAIETIVFPYKLSGKNMDKRIRKFIYELATRFDNTRQFFLSEEQNRHPENIDMRSVSSGREFIYNFTKSVIKKTIYNINQLINREYKYIQSLENILPETDSLLISLKNIW